MAMVPIHIATERLLIRPLEPTDIEAMHAVFSDPEVMRYVPGGACDRERSRSRLQSLIEHQKDHGFSKWAVAEKDSGHLIGDCGLQYLDGGPDIELGFHLARAHWGHGYATEVARACPRVGPRRTSRACRGDRNAAGRHRVPLRPSLAPPCREPTIGIAEAPGAAGEPVPATVIRFQLS
jgi:Acetyltransferase (GNAT) domain